MKKNKINILLAAAMLMGTGMATSCSDSFLDVESATESNSGTFYKTESDAWRALIGCYAGWRETTSAGSNPLPFTTMIQSDECLAGAGKNDAHDFDVIDQHDLSQAPSYTNLWEGDWKAYYAAIYRCNELIQKYDLEQWGDNQNIKNYIGEAHALRALCYFDLVRMFENVPLITVPTQDNVPQADPDEVYAQIFADLKVAIDNIAANAYPKSNSSSNEGHVTRYGAEAIMARAYLYYSGRFGKEPADCSSSDALQACEDVINSGQYGLVPQFKNLWPAASTPAFTDEQAPTFEDLISLGTWAGEGNNEFVLVMKCNDTQDYNGNNDGNRWLVNIGIRGISSIDCSPYGYGWGIATVNPDLVAAYGSGDERKNASIINIAQEGIDQKDGFQDNCINDSRQYTGFYVKKYTPMASTSCTTINNLWNLDGDAMTSQWQSPVIVRYSDVLLMAAELGSVKAQQYFNQVRQRAYTNDEGNLNSGYVELPATKENIMKERRLEFAFEGLRYYDLLRQGIDVAANTIAGTVTSKTEGVATTTTIKAENIRAKKGLCQIPNNQITLSNGLLKQNDGWK